MEKERAVVLLSGGLDSATVLGKALADGMEVYPISFRYGQKHNVELERAEALVKYYGITDHLVMDIDLASMGGSSLVDPGMEIPTPGDGGEGIPSTYVPGRNIIFLGIAFARAEILGSRRVYIGANIMDYSGYPDCRPEFLEAFNNAANLGLRSGGEGKEISLEAPLVDLSKSEIIKLGLDLGVPYQLTWSCYRGGDRPCGECDSCFYRARGFREAGIPDPALGD